MLSFVHVASSALLLASISAASVPTLFISEMIEGGSYNKVITLLYISVINEIHHRPLMSETFAIIMQKKCETSFTEKQYLHKYTRLRQCVHSAQCTLRQWGGEKEDPNFLTRKFVLDLLRLEILLSNSFPLFLSIFHNRRLKSTTQRVLM